MELHERLRSLGSELGHEVFDDADSFRGALDDYVDESEATTGDINILVDAVRLGAYQRMLNILEVGASPAAAVDGAGELLARERGSADVAGSRWACAVLGYAIGAVDDAEVRRHRTTPSDGRQPAILPGAAQGSDEVSPEQAARGNGDDEGVQPTVEQDGASDVGRAGSSDQPEAPSEVHPPLAEPDVTAAASSEASQGERESSGPTWQPPTPPATAGVQQGQAGQPPATASADGGVAQDTVAPTAQPQAAGSPDPSEGQAAGAPGGPLPYFPDTRPPQQQHRNRAIWIALAAVAVAALAGGGWYAIAQADDDGSQRSDAGPSSPTTQGQASSEPTTSGPSTSSPTSGSEPTQPTDTEDTDEPEPRPVPKPFESVALLEMAQPFFAAGRCEKPRTTSDAPAAMLTPDKELVKCADREGVFTGTFWCKGTTEGLLGDRAIYLDRSVGPINRLNADPAGPDGWTGYRVSFQHETGHARVYWDSKRTLCAAEIQGVGDVSIPDTVQFWRQGR